MFLQSIDNLIAENSAVKIMFKISSYKSGNGQSYRKFYMNRDGFSLLAMGFTGREAPSNGNYSISGHLIRWRTLFVKNLLRCGLKPVRQENLPEKAETDTIQKLVEYAKGQGSSHAEMLYMTYSGWQIKWQESIKGTKLR